MHFRSLSLAVFITNLCFGLSQVLTTDIDDSITCRICHGYQICGRKQYEIPECPNGIPCTAEQYYLCGKMADTTENSKCDQPGKFPHPKYPNKFFTCDINTTMSFDKRMWTCPTYQTFDPLTQRCLSKEEKFMLQAVLNDSRHVTAGDVKFVCTGVGLFSNPHDCKMYHSCNTKLESQDFYCPDGTYFDGVNCTETKQCLEQLQEKSQNQLKQGEEIYGRAKELMATKSSPGVVTALEDKLTTAEFQDRSKDSELHNFSEGETIFEYKHLEQSTTGKTISSTVGSHSETTLYTNVYDNAEDLEVTTPTTGSNKKSTSRADVHDNDDGISWHGYTEITEGRTQFEATQRQSDYHQILEETTLPGQIITIPESNSEYTSDITAATTEGPYTEYQFVTEKTLDGDTTTPKHIAATPASQSDNTLQIDNEDDDIFQDTDDTDIFQDEELTSPIHRQTTDPYSTFTDSKSQTPETTTPKNITVEYSHNTTVTSDLATAFTTSPLNGITPLVTKKKTLSNTKKPPKKTTTAKRTRKVVCAQAGYFTDPKDCHSYFSCKTVYADTKSRKLKLVATHHTCKNGAWFSQIYGKCVRFKPKNC